MRDAFQLPGNSSSYQRLGPFANIASTLADFGVDHRDILSKCGLKENVLDNPENTIPFLSLVKLLGRCVHTTNCKHFGLLVGRKASLSSLGVLGMLLRHAPTVGQAIDDFIANQHRIMTGDILYSIAMGDNRGFAYSLYHSNAIEVTGAFTDTKLAAACNVVRALGDVSPIEVHFARKPPQTSAAYTDIFRAPIRFNAEISALIYDKRAMEAQIDGANVEARAQIRSKVEAYWAAAIPGIVPQLHRALFPKILLGPLRASDAAKAMSMHLRTLNRRLEAEGTSFRSEADRLRFEIATQLLAHTSLSITHISMALGHSTHPAFTRAFRRWSGASPSAKRAEFASRG